MWRETWAVWGSRAGDIYRNETQTNKSPPRRPEEFSPGRKGLGLKKNVISDFKRQGAAGMWLPSLFTRRYRNQPQGSEEMRNQEEK